VEALSGSEADFVAPEWGIFMDEESILSHGRN